MSCRPFLVIALFGASSCVVQSVDPHGERFLGAEWVATGNGAAQTFAGLVLEEALLGSLEDLDFAMGLRVAEVVEGSPAEAAGLRRGDVVVRVGDLALESLDQWAGLLDAAETGQTWQLEVERDHDLHRVDLVLAVRFYGELPATAQCIERLKLRAVFESRSGAVHLVRLLAGSPLDVAEVPPGSRLVAIDEVELRSARQLAEAIAACDYGDSITLEVRGEGREPREVDVTLWEPPTRLTEVSLPILFYYDEDPVDDRVEVSFLDFWLFSVFGYERDGATRRYSILRFIAWETGTGELADLAAGEDA
jgi:membrane-associated protease RseP (regulator of RpoE activity)